ncbi:MAG: hypothetical protein APF81_23900 [Desulfosporosinus sp. BRH_c37]|nr:MAG: hypothetical protein APF81_23900 [Desulfosporosinus sp. BRH_c37]
MGKFAYKKVVKNPAKSKIRNAITKDQGMPNSALLGMLGGSVDVPPEDSQKRMDAHGESIRSRMPSAPRPQAQIPAAEREADRLSGSVTSGTPDVVKSAMSRKLGADFSGVHLHTDSASSARAVAMGARAFTAGSDIYFGPDGFDAG